MRAVSKNVYIDKLNDIVTGYNDTYYRTIKMKPGDVKNDKYFDFPKEFHKIEPKLKVDDRIRIL